MLYEVITARDELAKRAIVKSTELTSIWDKTPAKTIRTIEQSALKGWQIEVMEARAALLAEVDRLSIQHGRNRAINVLIQLADSNDLPPALIV